MLTVALALLLLSLAAWIVVPAPTMPLLPLGIAAPEISIWFLLLSLPLLIPALRLSGTQRLVALSALGITIFLSMIPLVQVPSTTRGFAQATSAYDAPVPQGRSTPWSLIDNLFGIRNSVAREKSLSYMSHGVPLRMNVYLPPNPGKYPVLVVLYGGAWRSGSPDQGAGFSRYMVSQGYAVVALDYRHAPRYPFPAQLEDVRAGLAFIKNNAASLEADPDRMALLGRSSGGHLAMLAAYQPDSGIHIRAVVSFYGPVDLIGGYQDPPVPDPIGVRNVLESFTGGTPETVRAQYEKASPITWVRSGLPPTLLLYGVRDHLVKVEFARNLRDRSQAAGNSVTLLEFPWSEHGFDAVMQGAAGQIALYHTERFLAWALKR